MAKPASSRLLIISPVRNEASHIERVVAAVQAQTRPPDLWVVADDGSDDDTAEILERLSGGLPYMRVVRVEQSPQIGADRLALALEARAFNAALATVDLAEFTHLGKLDGDIELPTDYFERLLESFAVNPRLGITGGSIIERRWPAKRWVRVNSPSYHVHGALKLYSRECFAAIGGVEERLGWDTIDETYARMRGFRSLRHPDLVSRHHRPAGSAQGRLRGCARHGQCAYIATYPLWWVLLRSFKVAVKSDPWLLSGVAFFWGWFRSWVRRSERTEDGAFSDFVRRELRARVWHKAVGSPRRARERVVDRGAS
jgi:biofilm PGA synthesis N-glycosyltransferase PgaC